MGNEQNLILSVNAGSSSLKISVFTILPESARSTGPTSEPVSLILTSNIENLTAPPAVFSFKPAPSSQHSPFPAPTIPPGIAKKDEKVGEDKISDHKSAFAYFLTYLEQNTQFEKTHVRHVCHRVVHGGDYPTPVRITNETFHHIETLSDLAPLHNGRALQVIEACLSILPDADSIAFFDSMFHSTMPKYVSRYAINPEVAESKGLRKYGFHGLSYSYILRASAAHLSLPLPKTSLIVLHLGSGASVCAIRNGQSLDTSMGLTPLDGLPGATRAGSVDASLIFHYTSSAGRISRRAAEAVEITDAEEILNKESGWKSLAGTTDFAVIAARANLNTAAGPGGADAYPNESLAFNILVDRILTYVGSYFLKLGGSKQVNAIVFSGGIGERSAKLRKAVIERCVCLGFAIDDAKNESVSNAEGKVFEIGEGENGMKTLVCRTDEQLEMARQCILKDNIAD